MDVPMFLDRRLTRIIVMLSIMRQYGSGSFEPTSLLLLHCELVPVDLHPIPKLHPQVGLLLRRHGLPSLLDIRQSRVAYRMGLSPLRDLLRQRCELSGAGTDCARREAGTSEEGGAQHGGGMRAERRQWEDRMERNGRESCVRRVWACGMSRVPNGRARVPH